MKTRVLIIIGIIIAIGIVTMILTMNFSEDKNITVSDNTPEQLKTILRICTASNVFVGTVSFSYYNDTHTIDTVNCKWIENEN
jgi:hypothetical protein